MTRRLFNLIWWASLCCLPVSASAETVLTPHETLTLLMESDYVNCSITIQPEIINGSFYDHQDYTIAENTERMVSQLGWNFYPPATIYNGECKRTVFEDFHEGHPIVIHANPSWQKISEGVPHYFFYISKDMDTGPDYKYQINWNGSLEWSHAQWHITDTADLEKRGTEHCLIDEKVQLCFQ